MINVDLRNLISRISPNLKELLEKAATNAMRNSNYAIELDHLFVECLLSKESLWQGVVAQGQVSRDALIERVSREINTLPKGNTQAPSLSASLVEALKDAWLLASLNAKQNQITELHVLLVLKERTKQAAYGGCLLNWVSDLSETALKAAINALKVAPLATGGTVSGGEASAEASTVALEKYASNITEQARNGKLDRVLGRLSEIRIAIDILCRRRQNSHI